jgi:ferritin-like metal-binding protein YciE
MFSDELVKNALLDYATEQFEMACYIALESAARDLGDAYVGDICREIIRDEQEMADWIQTQLPQLVREVATKA